MDLESINPAKFAARGQKLHLRHPVTDELLHNEDGEPITITLLGRDAPEYRRFMRNTANAAMRKGKNNRASIEQLEQQSADLLAAVTVAWENVVLEGEALECTPDNAARVYRELPFVREQVDEFVEDRSNFLK